MVDNAHSAQRAHLTMLRLAVIERINSGHNFPVFPSTINKLNTMMQSPDCGIGEIADLIAIDPGLAGGCLRLANSAAFAGSERIANLRIAAMRLGVREIRRMICSIVIVGSVSHMKVVKIDWKKYWLHSVLTARLAERLTAAYQDVTGMEYLAGLIHDIGKLMLEHHFPRQFESVILELNRKSDLIELEMRMLGISHAEVCALVAERWNLDQGIVQAVRTHHIPEKATLQSLGSSPGQQIRTTCLALANRLANQVSANCDRNEQNSEIDLASMPEWVHLQHFSPRHELELNLDEELAKAEETLQTLPIR